MLGKPLQQRDLSVEGAEGVLVVMLRSTGGGIELVYLVGFVESSAAAAAVRVHVEVPVGPPRR